LQAQELIQKHEGAFESQVRFNAVVAQKIKPIISEYELRQHLLKDK
jgi:hypothetical protein